MASFDLYDSSCSKSGKVEVSDHIVSAPIKPELMHEVVLMQLSSRRSGNHSTKTRSDVRGSTAKPWRQKGTGRARAGTKKSPLWRSGGVTFGPHPRDYSYSMPKKKVKSALRSAISSKIESTKFLKGFSFADNKTKEANAMLKGFESGKKSTLVVHDMDDPAIRAFRNIEGVRVLHVNGLNVYDVLNCNSLYITEGSLPRMEEVLAK